MLFFSFLFSFSFPLNSAASSPPPMQTMMSSFCWVSFGFLSSFFSFLSFFPIFSCFVRCSSFFSLPSFFDLSSTFLSLSFFDLGEILLKKEYQVMKSLVNDTQLSEIGNLVLTNFRLVFIPQNSLQKVFLPSFLSFFDLGNLSEEDTRISQRKMRKKHWKH